jgi:hypothetical protein
MTVYEYVSHPGCVVCPSCHEDNFIDADIMGNKLTDLQTHGMVPVECYHCDALFMLRNDWTTELIYNCRFCDDGTNLPERDTWNQSTETHSTIVENCEKCGRGKW